MAMDHDTSVSWSEQLPGETLMAHANEDDFSTFLEFGLDFADLEGHGSPAVQQHQHQHQRAAMQHPDHSITTSMAEDARIAPGHASPYAPVVSGHLPVGIPNNGPVEDHAFHFSHEQQQAQQHQHHQQQQQHMASHNHPQLALQHQDKYPPHTAAHSFPNGQHVIPPTPNSIELHGGAARYPQRVDMGSEIYDRYGQMNDDQAAFYTPLISPAMTPLETQFRLPEYTIPGEYFTPLTSPALEPQGSNNNNNNGFPFQQTKQPPSTQAPGDPATSMGMTSAPSSPAVLRRQRRRPSTATRTGGRAAKASPSIQPKNWRKQAMTTQLVADDLANNCLGQDARLATGGGSSLRYSGHESSQDSVSPEPISEPLMPPPAIPSARRSPAFRPQVMESDSSAPATPATLMRINNRPQEPTGQFSGFASLVPNDVQDELMEDVVLPEAAATDIRPRPSRIDTAINSKEQHSAHSTPVDPKSATERPASGSLTPAPHSGAMPSPSGPIPKKSDSKAVNGRKRHSVSSSHASPALRPRISPSIQPLVRGEGMTGESSALYLASKSNYQHILDGTLLPGVSYPESLAENLSSKRTNHKLAEQGRRNRINTALKEIEALLPPGFTRERAAKESKEAGAAKSGEKEKDKNAQQTISKASTVEMAIDYIKALQQELDSTKSQLNIAVSKLAAQSSNSPNSAANSTDAATENSVSPA